MKRASVWLCLALVTLVIPRAAAGAETVYVTEEFEITLRATPGADRKIVAMAKSGKPLELVEKGDEWSLVRIPNGKEGWAQNRYLTTASPSALVLERVRQDYEGLEKKYKELKEKFDALTAQKKASDADLSQSRRGQDELNAAYERLKRESSEFIALKQKHQDVSAQLEAEKARATQLDEENRDMRRDGVIQWVLAGGGIMLAGFFIGLLACMRRKPRSSLY
jgi:SH3 domain protein